jgi:hypothetical protein
MPYNSSSTIHVVFYCLIFADNKIQELNRATYNVLEIEDFDFQNKLLFCENLELRKLMKKVSNALSYVLERNLKGKQTPKIL